MPSASIQFSQGVTTGGAGQSVLGFVTGTQVNFTDAAGGGASSWAWSIVGWPGSLGSAPTIVNPSSQTANIASPSVDGVYVIKLVRTDPGPVVTTDVRFFAIGDADYGYCLPSAGMTGNMTNIGGSSVAQNAGWEGTASASTNVFVDGLLRFLRASVGRFFGPPGTINFSSASPLTTTIVDGTDKPWRTLNLTGSGLYTEQIANTSPVPTSGKKFSYTINITAGSGGFALLDGVGGSTILALSAPPSGTTKYSLDVGFNGTDWVVQRIGRVDPLALSKSVELIVVSGVQTSSTTTFQRVGNLQIDPTAYPSNVQATFNAVLVSTSASVSAVVQLYNLTDGGVVTASPVFPLSSSAQTPTLVSTTLTLPAASKLYEVQLKMSAASGTNIVTCSYASVKLTWG
jgi:hypothetical protein